MTKGSTRSSRVTATTPLPSSKQARLVGINDYLKSVRQRSTISNSARNRLKQAGLAVFGFDGVNTIKTPGKKSAIEAPPSKKRKVAVGLEIPETQFDQSPEPSDFNPFSNAGDVYSSPLSSPPLEGSSPIMPPSPTSSFIAMPPPAVPMTPKRARLVEIPDSKSPPFTPFTPYVSQQEKNRSGSPSSPTVRLKKSPISPQVEGDDDDGSEMSSGSRSPALVPTQILPRKPFSLSPKLPPRRRRLWRDEDGNKDEQGGEIIENEEVTLVDAESGDRDRVIKSSQWWENEDTQDAPLSTQYAQNKQPEEIATVSESLRQDMGLRESIIGPIHDEESFCVNLSYEIGPPLDITDENNFNGDKEFQDANQLGHEDVQESFCSMKHPIPLKFHDDSSDTSDDPVLPMGEDSPGSTANEEGPDVINESQAYPAYGAYRTQQFPSSFYQHNTYRHSSPEFLQSSQFIPPVIINRADSAATEENRDEEEPPQFLPEPVGGVGTTPRGDSPGKKEPLQFLPGMAEEADITAEDDSQFLLAMRNKSDAVPADEIDNSHEEEQEDNIRDDDDGDGEGLRGRRTGTITRSQLLPSELMETFPMPPPLSQFSSYEPYSYEYMESETQ